MSRPYDSRAVNIISFYNEVSVSLYLYLAFMLSNYLETQFPDNNDELIASLRLRIAWILTILLMFTILINFLYTLFKIFYALFAYLKSKITTAEMCKRQEEEED